MQVDVGVIESEYAVQLGKVLDEANRRHNRSVEVELGRRAAAGAIEVLSTPRFCAPGDCNASAWAHGPMRAAVDGERGTTRAHDYRNAPVLAAFEPVKAPALGLVVKIDLTEVLLPTPPLPRPQPFPPSFCPASSRALLVRPLPLSLRGLFLSPAIRQRLHVRPLPAPAGEPTPRGQ